jgi:signal transduction histidine kinase
MQLATWLADNRQGLLEEIEAVLSGRTTLQPVPPYAAEFLDNIIKYTFTQDAEALQSLLRIWQMTDLDATWMNVLLEIQRRTIQQIQDTVPPAQAATLLIALQDTFAPLIMHLSDLTTEIRLDILKRELKKAARAVSKLDKNRTDFISVAAHELKTPLTLIDGYTNILKMHLAEDNQADTMLRGISGGIKRLLDTIEDMIDVSIVEMDILNLKCRPVALLNQVLQPVVNDMQKYAAERSIRLQLNTEDFEGIRVDVDTGRIYKAFQEVIENAIKYTPDQGNVTIWGTVDEDKVIVAVQDSGIGIDPEDQPLIFEKFFTLGQVQLHSSSKFKFKGGGSGLGLAIAKGIILAHHGTIRVESQRHDEEQYPGTTFYITLTVAPSQEDHEPNTVL